MKKKIIIISAVTILSLGVFGFIGFNYLTNSSRVFPHALDYKNEYSLDKLLSKKEVEEDRNELIKYVEDVHPIFIDGCLPSDYEVKKNELISNTNKEMTLLDFKVELSKYMTTFNDGHTVVSWYNSIDYLNLKVDYIDDKLVKLNGDNNVEKEIISIGGINISNVLSFIDNIFPVENEMMKVSNYASYSISKAVLSNLLDTSSNVEVTYADSSKENISFIEASYGDYENTYKYIDDTLYIDFNSCHLGEDTTNCANAIVDALKNNKTDIIIDARGNGGGNSKACTQLIESMGMKAPKYGSLIRCSREASYQMGYLRNYGTYESSPSLNAIANDKVNLKVLSDRDTFSSATMLLVFVRDGKLGQIIGEPSSNMPNSYGDIYEYQLKNSRIYGHISHKKFTRPDKDNKENMLIPDVRVSRYDALNKALEK